MELGDVLPSFLFLSNEKTHDTRLQFLTFLPQVSEAAHRTLYYPRDMHIPVQRKYLLSPKSCTLVPVTGWTTLHLLRVVRVAQRYIFRNVQLVVNDNSVPASEQDSNSGPVPVV